MNAILATINSPNDLKKLQLSQLKQLASEIREFMINIISQNGGHLASSLGAVELTIALHRVFNSPQDKIIWDVGHQAYAHKILTGRRDLFTTIRQYGGISGFPVRTESPHDAFGAGHSGTSISAALGMVIARDLNKGNYHVVAVIGDGSLGNGMVFEALNHAGHLGKKIIVVLNDNGMSISPSVGALSRLLNRVRLDANYYRAKRTAKIAIEHMPFGESAWQLTRQVKRRMEKAILPTAFWDELGFTYLGPFDGHDIAEIEAALTRARDVDKKPTVVHVLTQKGKGLPEAERNATKYHGVSPNGNKKSAMSYSTVFGRTMSRLMRENNKIVAISAAMLDGTGLADVAVEFPDRVFDVGICEQHAVTLAAGMATQGYIPVVAIYSTFLQRAYDQIIHDVCLQNLPVVFAIDRAGIVGEDGRTHQGPFDISYLRCIPNITIAAPSNEDELQHLLYTAVGFGRPFAIRYPRGCGTGIQLKSNFYWLSPGKGEVLREGKDLTIVAVGQSVQSALQAAETLFLEDKIDCKVINARYIKPLDKELIINQIDKIPFVLTVEENAYCGGFGSAVMELLSENGYKNIKLKTLGLPDVFIEHGTQEQLRSALKLDADGIQSFVLQNFPELMRKYSLISKER